MDILYQPDLASASEIHEALTDAPASSAGRAKLLEEKGHVRHEEEALRYVYFPALASYTARCSALRHMVSTLFEGSIEEAVAAHLDRGSARRCNKDLDRLANLVQTHSQKGIRMKLVAAMVGLVAIATAAAQPRVTFDAASVKPAVMPDGVTVNGAAITAPRGSGTIPRNTGGPGSTDPGRIHYPFISLKELLVRAYGSSTQIAGPAWLDSQFVAVDATMPPGTTQAQFQEMLRNLIVDRFQLKFHVDRKEAAGYILGLAKGGLKIKEGVESPMAQTPEDSGPAPRPPIGADGFPVRSRLLPGQPGAFTFMGQGGRRRMYGQLQTMQALAKSLEFQLVQDAGPNAERVAVTDETGLTARYDFTLTYSREGTPDAEIFPDIFTALQSQLGLKLDRKKISSEAIVIDHIERVPSEN